MNKQKNTEKGTALVTLLVFMVVAITVTTGTVIVATINTQGTSKFAQSEQTSHMAEAGIEEAQLQILRNPDYTGSSFIINEGTVTITVSGTTSKTIISEAVNGNFIRKVEATGDLSDNEFTLNNWRFIE